MKKFYLVFGLFILGSLCFGKGQRDSFEVGIGYQRMTEIQRVSGVKVKTRVPSFAINYAGETFFTENAGIGAYGNLLFPQEFKASAQGQSVTVDKSAYDFLFAMDFLLGPVFVLYKTERFYLPVAVGIHYYHLWANTFAGSQTLNEIGPGVNVTGEYHFNPKLYVYGRFQLTFDLYAWQTGEVYAGTGSSSIAASGNLFTWGIEPCAGIGFKW